MFYSFSKSEVSRAKRFSDYMGTTNHTRIQAQNRSNHDISVEGELAEIAFVKTFCTRDGIREWLRAHKSGKSNAGKDILADWVVWKDEKYKKHIEIKSIITTSNNLLVRPPSCIPHMRADYVHDSIFVLGYIDRSADTCTFLRWYTRDVIINNFRLLKIKPGQTCEAWLTNQCYGRTMDSFPVQFNKVLA